MYTTFENIISFAFLHHKHVVQFRKRFQAPANVC